MANTFCQLMSNNEALVLTSLGSAGRSLHEVIQSIYLLTFLHVKKKKKTVLGKGDKFHVSLKNLSYECDMDLVI